MMTKNEKLKQANIEKISLFLNKKYNKVFKDRQFTIDILKYEVSRLLLGKNMKTFNFNDCIKKIEKAILKKLSNYGELKYEPIQMTKINDLLSYQQNPLQKKNQIQRKNSIPSQNNLKIKAPKSANDRRNSFNSQKRIQSALPQNKNINLNNNNDINNNIYNNGVNNTKNNEIPYRTEKMEKLREKEKNKWAIQANKDHEQYLREQEQIKKLLYEKKLKQREILEQQIKEKKEMKRKIREEEKFQPALTSLNLGNEITNNNIINNKQNEKPARPLSSNPFSTRIKEENEYQKKIKEDLKKYEEEEKIKKKTLREKYKEIEKENYENALKKKQAKLYEKEQEKNQQNDLNMFDEEANRTLQLMKMKQKNVEDLYRINQNMKHQIAINNYEEQKYKREREQEQKKINDEELQLKEKKIKMINDYKKGLDEQVKEKQMIREINNKVKIDEKKDYLNIKNQIQEEKNLRYMQKYEKINNYKRELDEQIEKNKKFKKNNELLD